MNGDNDLEIFQLALVASVAVAGVTGAIIAAWRMIPFRNSPEGPTAQLGELEEAVEAIRLSVIDLADKYEITIRRNNVRVGRLRRKVARLQGDDEEDDPDVEPAPDLPLPVVAPAAPAPLTKAQRFLQYNAALANGGRT